MLTLIVGMIFAGSTPESSVGYPSSNLAGSGSELCMIASYPSPGELSDQCLLPIVSTIFTEHAIVLASSVLALCPNTGMNPLLVINALLKRIMHKHPVAREYINGERYKPNPNRLFGLTGPTPEILLNAVSKYVPPEEQYLYFQLLDKYFKNETCTWKMNCRMYGIEMANSTPKSIKEMRAFHKRPWRP